LLLLVVKRRRHGSGTGKFARARGPTPRLAARFGALIRTQPGWRCQTHQCVQWRVGSWLASLHQEFFFLACPRQPQAGCEPVPVGDEPPRQVRTATPNHRPQGRLRPRARLKSGGRLVQTTPGLTQLPGRARVVRPRRREPQCRQTAAASVKMASWPCRMCRVLRNSRCRARMRRSSSGGEPGGNR
jgi:hypothetical protein